MKTEVKIHIQPENAMDEIIVLDCPFSIVPNLGDVVQLNGQEGYYKVIGRQFLHCNILDQSWINKLLILVKKI